MSEEKRKILDMLSQGKITVSDAEKLLNALDSGQPSATPGRVAGTVEKSPRYLRVVVEPAPDNPKGEKVNIRVPLKLIRAGLKFTSLIPKQAHSRVNDALHEKGIDMDFNQIRPEDLDEIVTQLNDVTVDVEGKENVKIFCE